MLVPAGDSGQQRAGTLRATSDALLWKEGRWTGVVPQGQPAKSQAA